MDVGSYLSGDLFEFSNGHTVWAAADLERKVLSAFIIYSASNMSKQTSSREMSDETKTAPQKVPSRN